MKKIIPYVSIGLAASLWGLIAIFVRGLKEAGFSEMEIVTIRVTFASMFLLIIALLKFKDSFRKFSIRKIHLFIGTGICSIAFFNWCYFTAINQMNVSLAVILLYTSPAFVTILSFLFLKESLHSKKILAVAGTILGCVLIAGVQANVTSSITLVGVLIGLGAGLGYALYSIFGKIALRHYDPFTVTLYTFIVASIALLPFTGAWGKLDLFLNVKVLMYSVGLGLVPTVIAYFLYTWGLERTESSKASVIATVEPIVATILGVFFYFESIGFIQVVGSVLILVSVVIVNMPVKDRNARKDNIIEESI